MITILTVIVCSGPTDHVFHISIFDPQLSLIYGAILFKFMKINHFSVIYDIREHVSNFTKYVDEMEGSPQNLFSH